MKKKSKILIFIFSFFIAFIMSMLIHIRILGSAPMKLLQVNWNDTIGTIYKNLSYENDNGNMYDLYIPNNINKSNNQKLILFIHGGSFNSGSKEDMDYWCKFYTSKGYVTATVDYTLQNHGLDATIQIMDGEIENAVIAINNNLKDNGFNIDEMAVSGVSAGGTLALNLAYNGNSVIPVKFVFVLAAPTYFDPYDWSLLKKVKHIKTDEEFIEMMTGYTDKSYINEISPASKVNENSAPTLLGYGLKDHCVSLNQKYYLINSLEENNALYDYIEFPNSNHGMYNDLDKLQYFIEQSLEKLDKYLK